MSTSNFSVCLAEPVAKVQMWQTEARGEIVIRSTDYCTVCFTCAFDLDSVAVARALAASLIAAADDLEARVKARVTETVAAS